MVETLVRLSLGEAAKAVRKHPSTLTKAVNHKDSQKRLPFTLDDDGERLFSIPDLQKRFGKVYSPEDDSPVDSLVKEKRSPVESPVRTGENPAVFTSEALVHEKEIHQVRTSAYEKEVSMLKDTNRRLEGEVESWKTQAKSWQNHADNSLRLLTDERAKSEPLQPDIDLELPEQSRGQWRKYVAVFATVAVLGGGYFYRTDLAQQWAKITAENGKTAVSIGPEIPQG